jgi:hypothetical protein
MPRVEAIKVGGYTDVDAGALKVPIYTEGTSSNGRRRSIQGDPVLERRLVVTGRPCRDVAFAILYALLLALAALLVMFAGQQAERNGWLSHLDYPPFVGAIPCPPQDGPGLMEKVGIQSTEDFMRQVGDKWHAFLIWGLVVPVIGFCFVQLLRMCAKPVVYISLVSWPILIGFSGIAVNYILPVDWVGGDDGDDAQAARQLAMYICLAVAAFWFLILWCIRNRIERTIMILQAAGEALSQNTGVFFTALSLFLLWLVVSAGLLLGVAFAVFNGEWQEPDGEAAECKYQLDTQGSLTMSSCLFVLLWTGLLYNEVRGCTVAGTVGHWYYHAADASPPLTWPSVVAASWRCDRPVPQTIEHNQPTNLRWHPVRNGAVRAELRWWCACASCGWQPRQELRLALLRLAGAGAAAARARGARHRAPQRQSGRQCFAEGGDVPRDVPLRLHLPPHRDVH